MNDGSDRMLGTNAFFFCLIPNTSVRDFTSSGRNIVLMLYVWHSHIEFNELVDSNSITGSAKFMDHSNVDH